MTSEELDAIRDRLGAIENLLPWSFLGDAIRARDDQQVVIGKSISGSEAAIVHDAVAIFLSVAPDDISVLLTEVERLRSEVLKLQRFAREDISAVLNPLLKNPPY